MNKSEWYENRILWRAKKLSLAPYEWRKFSLSSEKSARKVLAVASGCGVPLFIFWLNDDIWTLLTNQCLVGRYRGENSVIDLDKLGKVSTVNSDGLSPKDLKRYAEVIGAGEGPREFWTPSGSPHFALRNVLAMFPIKIP
ncbi:hypothetical protein ACOTCH_06410 [Achromobacter xylosoxidans]|jgi:hypothetical protein|uniref:hypothetical protein n=1 Tax=Alcaligenes xylosoxydans xylosoxydans TaxID=85698 RepID=UPI001040EF88|nr:hypothetical protein [Achromobacter xylosoxidans]